MPKPPVRPPLSHLLAGLLAAAVLSGCSVPSFMGFPPQVRGNEVDKSELAQLVPGTSTRADVSALLGSPTAHATFDDNTWLYIIGNYETIFIFSKRLLQSLSRTGKYKHLENGTKTSVGFLLPKQDAEKYAAKILYPSAENRKPINASV